MTTDAARLETLAGQLVDEHDNLLSSLIEQRKKHHLTQAEVAERMGVSQPTIAAFEHYDANPTLATVRRYALAVGANIEHSVVDACCSIDESFEAIVTSLSGSWPLQRDHVSAPQTSWVTAGTVRHVSVHSNG